MLAIIVIAIITAAILIGAIRETAKAGDVIGDYLKRRGWL